MTYLPESWVDSFDIWRILQALLLHPGNQPIKSSNVNKKKWVNPKNENFVLLHKSALENTAASNGEVKLVKEDLY